MTSYDPYLLPESNFGMDNETQYQLANLLYCEARKPKRWFVWRFQEFKVTRSLN